ncbi:beclin-2 [Hippopotamus amphibius kiboko]|uniref:beclin-2 n=1 Tax=Hippopotamus amphibius kiboko TaxID=575201 RepID=UPI0025934050|nr:beclin-2 [Hippopotamus amphibius kiboko]
MSSLRFICQRCSQPLKRNQSMEMSQEPEALMLISAQGEPGETQEGGPPSREKADFENLNDSASCRTLPGLPGRRMSWDNSNNFILLGNLGSVRTINSRQKAASDIFDILSGERDVDHPLCEDCTDNLLEQLDVQVTITESEIQNYKCCLETREWISEDERETLQEKLKGLELEEARLVQELEEVEKNQERTAADLKAAQAETEMLDQQEKQYRKDYSKLKWQKLELYDALSSVETQLWYSQIQWDQLEKTNIFNATFEIWHDGALPTINNFRLGCLPTVPVCWNEINAAWGQTALLLLALSNTIGLEFQRYQLIPCGNHSHLKSLTDDCTELPLFSNGKNVFLHNKFDQAMMAFLDCMQQFKEVAEKGGSGLRLPYKIHVKKGLMEDPGSGGGFYPIRTHSNTEEEWTKALKLMLINFKCSLTWVSLRYCQK